MWKWITYRLSFRKKTAASITGAAAKKLDKHRAFGKIGAESGVLCPPKIAQKGKTVQCPAR